MRSSKARACCRTQVEEALAELVALGLVNSDSFGGLRALLVPSDRRRPTARDARRKRRMAIFGMQDAGRWALVRAGLQATGTGYSQKRRAPRTFRAPAPSLQPPAPRPPRRSSTSAAHSCAAGASCSGSCWSARRSGCRVARHAHVPAQARSTRRSPRRAICCRVLRRTVRSAGSHRTAARCPP